MLDIIAKNDCKELYVCMMYPSRQVEKFRLKLEVPGNESAKSEAASKAPPITHRAMERSALIVGKAGVLLCYGYTVPLAYTLAR